METYLRNEDFEGGINELFIAAGLSVPLIVGSLPVTGNYPGRLVLLSGDQKLYRWTGTIWTSAVPVSDVTGQALATDTARAALQIDDNTNTNRITLGNVNGTGGGVIVSVASSVDCQIEGPAAGAGVTRSCFTYKLNDMALHVNGVSRGVDTSCLVPSGLSVLRIGHASASSARLNGHILDAKYFPNKLVAAEAMAMSG